MSKNTRRKIHLPTGIWEYRISDRLTIVIWSPDGKKHVADTYKLTGRTWNELERGKRKQTIYGEVHPSEVKEYIETELLASAKGSK